ncbi:MAG: FAD-binding protein [Deltaproteobacteria bacterium]|nr:MAG: FAD-binding protein [Deltaproteobacteria bacterium]
MAKMDMDIIKSDVLIIGSGIAGLRAALEVSKRGKRALLVSKSPVGKANNTYLAGGGFAFATESFGVDTHIDKTLRNGRGLNDRTLVRVLASEAPSMVMELHEMGMRGTFQSTGFSARYSSLVGGQEITSTLVRACQQAGVRFLEGIMVTDLITDGQACYGAIGLQRRTGELYGFPASALLLATGGAGAIYAENDNAPGITGDGYVLGMEAGLELIDMEFVQFYPLVFAGSGHARMIVPPFFADLGTITNRLGEDLKEKYDFYEKPLAIVSRDRLSQALFREIIQGNGIDGALLLDIRKVKEDLIPVSNRLKELLRRRFSYDSKPIKITPACHYNMGGLIIDGLCRTAISGLFAAGEVVGGTDGANRMGGNGLSGSLVFGALAAESAVEYAGSSQALSDFKAVAHATAQNRLSIMSAEHAQPSSTRFLMRELRQVLWEKVGILRSERSLSEGIRTIDEILTELQGHRARNPQELCRIMECRNAGLTGRAISVSALARTESRGSHYRSDFPEEDRDWMKHIHVQMKNGLPNVARIVAIAE